MLFRLVVMALCLASALEQTHAEPTYQLIYEGRGLSSAQVKVLEEKLAKRPDDMESRTRLCAYYFLASHKNNELRPAFRSHVLWLIENQPRAEVLSEVVVRLSREQDPDAYGEARKLWVRQLDAFPKSVDVRRNAARWFLDSDRRFAEKILLELQADRPEYGDWPERLAELYRLDAAATTGEESRAYWRKAMEAHQLEYELTPEYARQHLQKPIGEAALACREVEIARRSAQVLLKERSGKPNPLAKHEGNILLGRIALVEGNVPAAKSHLSQAGKVSLTKDYDWMEPDFKLAEELLEKGEKDAVLTYLKDCRVFWKDGRKRLDRWTKLIRDGGKPMWEPFEEEIPDMPGGPAKK